MSGGQRPGEAARGPGVRVLGPLGQWVGIVAAAASSVVLAQSERVEPAEVRCATLLGTGIETGRSFCDILTGVDPLDGVVVTIPPHRGTATLSFDLSNRHTYSPAQVEAGQGYARYTSTIRVMTLDGRVLGHRVAQSEFRSEADLVDRVDGGAGEGGLKAVAPTGLERVYVPLAAGVTEVSILGERLEVIRLGGHDIFTAPGRPVAIISQVEVQYRPR